MCKYTRASNTIMNAYAYTHTRTYTYTNETRANRERSWSSLGLRRDCFREREDTHRYGEGARDGPKRVSCVGNEGCICRTQLCGLENIACAPVVSEPSVVGLHVLALGGLVRRVYVV